ncbi:MAG TPA: dimethylsulfonioproprionate lyase family protein [Kiloniellales bacterium]|nr:dimethylsulfonioproprionate lyase family protein [Kiloniellales bacterium]
MPAADPVEAGFGALCKAVREHYRAERARDPALAASLDPLIELLQRPRVGRRPARAVKPACALLPAALAAAERGPLADVARAFALVEPALAWTQNPNYSDAKLGQGYMAGYAYCDFIGPRGLMDSKAVALGVLLLGPGRLYPDHSHPAAEIYHVLSGTAEWSRDGGAFAPKPPGSAIHHAPWVRHAMRIGDETLFALYGWVGEVAVAADLVP